MIHMYGNGAEPESGSVVALIITGDAADIDRLQSQLLDATVRLAAAGDMTDSPDEPIRQLLTTISMIRQDGVCPV